MVFDAIEDAGAEEDPLSFEDFEVGAVSEVDFPMAGGE